MTFADVRHPATTGNVLEATVDRLVGHCGQVGFDRLTKAHQRALRES